MKQFSICIGRLQEELQGLCQIYILIELPPHTELSKAGGEIERLNPLIKKSANVRYLVELYKRPRRLSDVRVEQLIIQQACLRNTTY